VNQHSEIEILLAEFVAVKATVLCYVHFIDAMNSSVAVASNKIMEHPVCAGLYGSENWV
jgi:hypothetical protein